MPSLDARRTFKPYYNVGLKRTVCLDHLHLRVVKENLLVLSIMGKTDNMLPTALRLHKPQNNGLNESTHGNALGYGHSSLRTTG